MKIISIGIIVSLEILGMEIHLKHSNRTHDTKR